ncbi:MAG: hypothetical protein HYV06_07205 [Deltaproteobacteria bacterium]|nr:hypothetical protein [Deltaproteobacteria bacterium]
MENKTKFINLNGKGIFSSGDSHIEKPFTVQREFSYTLIFVQEDEPEDLFSYQFDISAIWSLSGQLEDGRDILADQLMVAKTGGIEKYIEFTPLASVVIGQSSHSPILEVRYPLVGMFDGEFSIEEFGWTIEVLKSDDNASNTKRQSEAWRVPMEGLTLRLKKTRTTLDEYHEKAREIMLLLSLATGNGVTSYRQIAYFDAQRTMEVWCKMTGDAFGPGAVVPDFQFGQFLKQVLPVWRQWRPDIKSQARLAIIYINLSGAGYLDIRLFQISQAWEFLATSWMQKDKLSDSECDLRKRIMASYHDWKNEHPKADPTGNWGSRITFPFKWPMARRQIESLAESGRINLSKIGLDFEALKKTRDSVAHTGKMTANQKGNYQLLAAAQFGLQLLLLAKLGYSGLVVTAKDGIKGSVPIDEYFQGW